MPRLIWVFAGRTVILLVLSWGGSIVYCHICYCGWISSLHSSTCFDNSNSSSLCLFQVSLAAEKVFHFDKFREHEYQNYMYLFSFRWLLTSAILLTKLRFRWQSWNYKEWIIIFVNFIDVMCKLRQITHKFNIKLFWLLSVCEWFAGVYTLIISTKLKFIPVIFLQPPRRMRGTNGTGGWTTCWLTLSMSHMLLSSKGIYEPCHKKTCLPGLIR